MAVGDYISNSGEHAYACLTSPDGKRRKTSSLMDDIDSSLFTFSQNLSQQLEEIEDATVKADEMQRKAISVARGGGNLFLTGKAGAGKSWCTKQIVKHCVETNKVIHVTAPTGIAAINVNGTTINSWGKFGKGEYCEFFSDFLGSTCLCSQVNIFRTS